MSESAILAGYSTANGTTRDSEWGILILAVLGVGLLIALLLGLVARYRSRTGTEAQAAADNVCEWPWAWVVVLLLNLPVPLLLGFAVASQVSALGMLAGIVVVWLAGHFFVTRVREVRGTLLVGGVFVGISQVLPITQVVAGLAAIEVLTRRGQLESPADAFAVTLLTAALLAVVALVMGLVLRAVCWLLDRAAQLSERFYPDTK